MNDNPYKTPSVMPTKTKTPVVGVVSWLNTAITLGVLAVFVLVGWSLGRTNGIFLGTLSYLVLSQTLRRVIARHHRKAIGHSKRHEFAQAITEFERSLDFFRANDWVDRFRAITMLSASGMSYREMALCGLGFCYAQLGDGLNARRNYEDCLREFPDNGMAESALRLLDAGASSVNAG